LLWAPEEAAAGLQIVAVQPSEDPPDAVIAVKGQGIDYCARSGSHCSKDAKTKLDVAQEILIAYISPIYRRT
jgi:hypothetical protein